MPLPRFDNAAKLPSSVLGIDFADSRESRQSHCQRSRDIADSVSYVQSIVNGKSVILAMRAALHYNVYPHPSPPIHARRIRPTLSKERETADGTSCTWLSFMLRRYFKDSL